MTQEEANKIIVKKGEGGCWHDWRDGWTLVCKKCGPQMSDNPDFSKWENFGRLMLIAFKVDTRPLNIIDDIELLCFRTNNESIRRESIDQIPALVSQELARILKEIK